MAEGMFARKSVSLRGAAVFSELATVHLSIIGIPQALFPITVPYFIFTPVTATIPEITSANPGFSNFTKHRA